MLPDEEATTDDAPLSMSEAITAYTAQPTEEADEGQSDDESGEEGAPLETDDEAQEGDDTGEEHPDDEGQADDEEAGEEQAEDNETEEVGGGRFAADDAKVTMRIDGELVTMTVAQLKSGNLMDRDYRQKTMAVAEEKKALASQSQAVEQTKQQLTEQQDYMSRLLQSLMPEPPKRPTVSSAADPFAWVQYQEQTDAYNNFAQHLRFIQQQQEGSKQELTAKQQKDRGERITAELEPLYEKIPDFRDPKKFSAFEADLISHAAEYGFTRDEVAQEVPLDHRKALVFRDAMSWRKLQASKAKVQDKTPAPRPPVQKGGKRLNPGAIQAQARKQAMDRLESDDSIASGVAAYLALQKQG